MSPESPMHRPTLIRVPRLGAAERMSGRRRDAEVMVPGHSPGSTAKLDVMLVSGQSTVTTLYATTPLKLLAPVSRGACAWVYSSSFGGGMVSGDQTLLDVRVGPKARCFLGTQSSTKVYRNPEARPTGHQLRAELGSGSLMVAVPDPIQAFAGSMWRQQQIVRVSPDADLVLVDWMTSGRRARGERWAFTRFESRNEIHLGDRPWFVDALTLDPTDGPLSGGFRMGRFDGLALVALVGPRVQAGARRWVEEIAARPVQRGASLLRAASVKDGGAVLRFAGTDLEEVAREIHTGLRFLSPWLEGEPWNRRG
jgi:urease accessory protein